MIALITPTGGRSKQFELCKQFMKYQTYTDNVLWIIIDDCLPITTANVKESFNKNWEIIIIYPDIKWKEGDNTQARNFQIAVDLLKTRNDISHVFIIEDDDFYRPEYLEKMMFLFNGYNLIGEKNTIYYNVKLNKALVNGNTHHSSLFQTAFTFDILPVFEETLNKKSYIDVGLWKKVQNNKLLFSNILSVGIKGIDGRKGIGNGHNDKIYNNLKVVNPENINLLFNAFYEYYK